MDLPNNRQQAVKRVPWKRKKYWNDYKAFINEIITKGYTEKVPQEILEKTYPGKAWYIPHHDVYHPKKPDKIRVVFNCNANSAGTSLNDQLLQGPDLTNLPCFRQESVAFMADIKAMFHQVFVPEEQHEFLCFLWWPNGDLTPQLEEY